jgi:hypothetical protein
MSQVTIQRPFGELDLGDQLGSRTEYGPRQPALRFDRGRIQSNLTLPYHRIFMSSCSSPSLGAITKRWSVRLVKMSLSETPRPLRTSSPEPLPTTTKTGVRATAIHGGRRRNRVRFCAVQRKPQDRATQPHPHLSNSFLRRELFSDGEGGCQSDGISRSLPTMS